MGGISPSGTLSGDRPEAAWRWLIRVECHTEGQDRSPCSCLYILHISVLGNTNSYPLPPLQNSKYYTQRCHIEMGQRLPGGGSLSLRIYSQGTPICVAARGIQEYLRREWEHLVRVTIKDLGAPAPSPNSLLLSRFLPGSNPKARTVG